MFRTLFLDFLVLIIDGPLPQQAIQPHKRQPHTMPQKVPLSGDIPPEASGAEDGADEEVEAAEFEEHEDEPEDEDEDDTEGADQDSDALLPTVETPSQDILVGFMYAF